MQTLLPERMLEHETQNIIQTLTERALGSAQSVALKDVLAADIPKSIKLYIRSETIRWLQTDLKGAGHFSNLRFATPFVQHLTKIYTWAMASEYVFTREEFVSTIENATHFAENYLCRPRWTLEHFVFEKSERVTPSEIQTKLEYVSDYLYYGKLIQGYMKLKDLREINREDFRTLLTTIDDRIVKQHSPKELAQLTRPIYEFLLLHQDINGQPAPIKPLVVFFDDKGMTLVKDYVERICRIRKTEQLTIEQLGEIIEDLYSKPIEQSNETFVPDVSQPDQDEPDEIISSNVVVPAEPSPPADESPQSLDSETTASHEGNETPPEPPEEETHRPWTPEMASDRRNVALSLTYSGMNETTPSSSLAKPDDLKKSIADDQRRRFVRAIFQNDEAYYNVVIEALNGMATWKDASLYLQMFYQASGLDPFVHDVVEFTDLIQQRYPPTPTP